MASTSLATRLLMAATEVVTSDGVGNYTYSADQGAKRHADRLHAHQVEFGLFLPVWMAEPAARVVFPKASGFDEGTVFKDECVRPGLADYVQGHGFDPLLGATVLARCRAQAPSGVGVVLKRWFAPPHPIGVCPPMAERRSRASMAICILQDAFCSGANDEDGCKMSLTAFRFPFPDNVEERCFGRLVQLLNF
ncbi:hypothetical protein NKI56_23310 [Mesorhizobium sp. M0622]|uniref:hypothetical protein n=1 Tax=unclassified Mesorhizobium TaxID=325217 RepID=UPI00333C26AF